MGILIGIIIGTLVIAGAGGGVYVLVFRAKHKKELLANSQMGNNLPTLGAEPAQQNQTQGLPNLGGVPNQGQGSPMASPVMNDITGGGLPQVPQAPAAPMQEEPSFMSPQEPPTINRSFPDTPQVPEAPVADSLGMIPEAPAAPANTFDLSQMDQSTIGSGSLLDDTETVGPVAGMAEDSLSNATDVDISDSTVPVTRENESLEQVESELGDVSVSAQTEEREEQNAAPEVPVMSSVPQPDPVSAPEPVVQPEPPVTPEPSISIPVQDFPNIGQSSEPQNTPSEQIPDVPIASQGNMSPMPGISTVSDFPSIPSAPQAAGSPENNTDSGTQEMHI
ncbi:MAG: hypothetical protein Q7S53_03745 [bacterium]|nr:hypothetical protein [bacterium]